MERASETCAASPLVKMHGGCQFCYRSFWGRYSRLLFEESNVCAIQPWYIALSFFNRPLACLPNLVNLRGTECRIGNRRSFILKFTLTPYTCFYTSECVELILRIMPTNLAIDDNLILEAQKLGHHRTKKAAVTAALDEYIQRRKQLEIISLFGTIDYDETYDYKRARRMKRT
jgi:hypothetical protein